MMWKPLQPPYFITFAAETDELYYIGVTDFRRYWITNTSRKSFLAELKACIMFFYTGLIAMFAGNLDFFPLILPQSAMSRSFCMFVHNIDSKTCTIIIILVCLQESNDGLEFDDEKELLQRGLEMITSPEDLQKVTIMQEENGKFLSVSIRKMYEITLKLELGLMEASADHVRYFYVNFVVLFLN